MLVVYLILAFSVGFTAGAIFIRILDRSDKIGDLALIKDPDEDRYYITCELYDRGPHTVRNIANHKKVIFKVREQYNA